MCPHTPRELPPCDCMRSKQAVRAIHTSSLSQCSDATLLFSTLFCFVLTLFRPPFDPTISLFNPLLNYKNKSGLPCEAFCSSFLEEFFPYFGRVFPLKNPFFFPFEECPKDSPPKLIFIGNFDESSRTTCLLESRVHHSFRHLAPLVP